MLYLLKIKKIVISRFFNDKNLVFTVLKKYLINTRLVITCKRFDDVFQMNVINLHSSCTMILLGILASTTIIGLTSSAPLSTYERRDVSDDRPKIFLLIDQRIPELEVCFLSSKIIRRMYKNMKPKNKAL